MTEYNKNIVPENHSKNVKKVKKVGFTHMKCAKSGIILPLEDFRIHKSGYYFSYCKKWEAEQAKNRRMEKKYKNL